MNKAAIAALRELRNTVVGLSSRYHITDDARDAYDDVIEEIDNKVSDLES